MDIDRRINDREAMVQSQIVARHVRDRRVLDAIRRIPRELFVPKNLAAEAYADKALPIGPKQTISQPYIVAFMTAALSPQPDHVVLEVGTGSGYQAAILAHLARIVHSIDYDAERVEQAAQRIRALKIKNVSLHVGDGCEGFAPGAPFDRIIVTAAAPRIAQAWLDQLADGGMIVAPIGEPSEQTLVRVTKTASSITETCLIPVRFVHMIGTGGFEGD